MFLEDLVSLCVAAGVGVYGTNIFVSSAATIPTGNGPFLGIAETGGTSPDNTQNDPVPGYERPGAQFVVHAKTYAAARLMAKAAKAAVTIENRDVNGIWYVKIRPNQNVFDSGLDADKRATTTFNILATKRPS